MPNIAKLCYPPSPWIMARVHARPTVDHPSSHDKFLATQPQSLWRSFQVLCSEFQCCGLRLSGLERMKVLMKSSSAKIKHESYGTVTHSHSKDRHFCMVTSIVAMFGYHTTPEVLPKTGPSNCNPQASRHAEAVAAVLVNGHLLFWHVLGAKDLGVTWLYDHLGHRKMWAEKEKRGKKRCVQFNHPTKACVFLHRWRLFYEQFCPI